MSETPDTSVTERVARAIKEAQSRRIYGLYDYSGYSGETEPHVVRNERTNAILLRTSNQAEAEAYWQKLVDETPAHAAIAAISSMPALEEENARLREAIKIAVEVMNFINGCDGTLTEDHWESLGVGLYNIAALTPKGLLP